MLLKGRRDAVIAEVVWFFRVSEIPESLYAHLLEDRRKGEIFPDTLYLVKMLIEFIDLTLNMG